MAPQFLDRLIFGEARGISGDLKQDAAGLVEVDGVEVLPIQHGCNVATLPKQVVAPGKLLLIVCCAPCYVMHCADCDAATSLLGEVQDVDIGAGTTCADLVAVAVVLLRHEA